MSDRAFIHQPFTPHIIMKPLGILMARLKGEAGFINVGNYENFEYEFEIEEEDIYSPQTPDRAKIASLVTQADITLSMELNQLTPLFRQIAMQSKAGLTFEQPAAGAQVYTIDDAMAGRIYPLPHHGLTAVAVEGAGAVAYVEGTHYQFDAATGNFEIIVHPGANPAETADIEITYSAAAIVGRKRFGLLSNVDIRCGLMFRSTNRHGPKQLSRFHDVQLRNSSPIVLGSNTTDAATASFEGKVFADPSKPVEYQYGEVIDLP